MNKTLSVGIIQTTLDHNRAWDINAHTWKEAVRMSQLEEDWAKIEIRHHLASIRNMARLPDIILLPELSVPIGFDKFLRRSAEKLESIIIAGLDYRILENYPNPTISNEAIMIVPKIFRGVRISRVTTTRLIGKSYAAPKEAEKLQQVAGGGVDFHPDPAIWIVQTPSIGDFGVTVCYDFLDLDRIALYKAKVQSLFVLSYNRDVTSFDHVAEAISRMVFCNVVVCNCGHYGGSVAIAPYRKHYLRTIYRNSGQRLSSAQVISLPLSTLREHQELSNHGGVYKSLPPGFGI